MNQETFPSQKTCVCCIRFWRCTDLRFCSEFEPLSALSRSAARSPRPKTSSAEHGVLQVNFTYQTTVDQNGNTLYLLRDRDRRRNPPRFMCDPGDRLVITLTNDVPAPTARQPMAAMPGMTVSGTPSSTCGAMTMTASSVNIHYHGTNTPPTAIRTK